MKHPLLSALTLLLLGLVGLPPAAYAAPHDVLFVLDNSGSMRHSDPHGDAKRVVAATIAKLNAEQRAGLIIFDQSVRLAVPLGAVNDTTRPAFNKQLKAIDYHGQLTDSPSAIERAIYELKTNGRAEATKAIVFMTDGLVDTGNKVADLERTKWLREELAANAAKLGIKIYAVAFTENADLFLIQALAQKTNGEYYRALTGAELGLVFAKIDEQLAAASSVPAPAVEATAPPPPAEPSAPSTPAASVPPEAAPVVPAPTVQAPTAAAPEPAAASTPAPAAPPAAPATGVELSAEERASLEKLAKETGVSVEQLMKEMESAPAGQAVVVRPEAAAPAAQPKLPNQTMTYGAIALGLLALLGAWLFLRGRGARDPAPVASTKVAPTPAMKPKAGEAFLLDTHGLTSEPTRRLTEKPVMIGRTAGTDTDYLDYFVVNKATIGRRHAIIKYKDFAFWIVDQGSVNGTYVNSERVLGERQLKHGDRVKLHKFEFEFSHPEMSDASRTVVGFTGDQTIAAGADSTIAAMSTSLQTNAAIATVALGAAAAATLHKTEAWVNQATTPVDEDPFDITKEGSLAALEKDRDDFFNGGGAPASTTPVELAVDEHDDTFDDDDLLATPARAANRAPAADQTQAMPSAPAWDQAADADASAFFEDVTVGPTPDFNRAPITEPETKLDMLDVTRVPGIDNEDTTANFAPPKTVMSGGRPGEGTGTRPPLDTGQFGELTTLVREDPMLGPSPDLGLDEFTDTASFGEPQTLAPQRPDQIVTDDLSVSEFTKTMTAADQAAAKNFGADTMTDDIFDVTGSSDEIPRQDTVVLTKSPYHKALDDNSSAPKKPK